ncbi:hypothetical protein ACFYT3_14605 [Nocardia amikacinitolerans]|uniref:hypothetical protein n=1 Tax=Nocardia amikacinitolerans TaxID=756689 RepID=UPI0020A43B57|nr:hypothetical protein [Nocardia amikacinitolerans]MCP2292733.1 hypothetical protein [Nocardia amikacinitolerans]
MLSRGPTAVVTTYAAILDALTADSAVVKEMGPQAWRLWSSHACRWWATLGPIAGNRLASE